MKVSNKLLETVIKQLLPNVQLAEDEDGLADINDIINAIDGNREPILKDRIKDSLHKELKGQFSGSLLRKLMRQTGATEADLKGAENDEDLIKKAVTFSLSKMNAAQEDVLKTIADLTSKHNSELDAIKAEYEGIIKSNKSTYEKRDITDYVLSELEGLSIRQGVDKKNLAKIVMAELESGNDLSFNYDEGKPSVFKKGSTSPSLNKSGNALFSWKEAIEDIVSPLGCITKDTGGVNPVGAMSGAGAAIQPNGISHSNNSLADINKAVAAAIDG